MSSDGSSFGSAGLYVGTDWRVRCSTYPDSTPIPSKADEGSPSHRGLVLLTVPGICAEQTGRPGRES